MKQIKNLTLAIVAGLLVLSVATVSCSKKSSGGGTTAPSTPTITGVTPTSGITIGTVLTINGTNFTGATVTIGGIAGTNVGIGATAITVTVPVGVTPGTTVAVIVTTSAGVSNTFTITVLAAALPPIDGYKTADSIASTNLKAYFPFDGNATEKISTKGTLTAHHGDAYATGKVGQALVLTNGYVVADSTIPNFNGAAATDNYQSYSVSLWVNQNGTAFNATNLYSPLFQLTGAQYSDIWGLFGVIISNPGFGGDTLAIGGVETQIDASAHTYNYSVAPRTTSSQYVSGNSGWHNIVLTYTGPAVTARIYVDGVKILTTDSAAMGTATNIAPPTTFNIGAGGGPKVPTFGTVAFLEDFPINYGGWGLHTSAASRPWAAHGMTCSLDEVRIYNAALTDAEAKALFDFGAAGR